MTNAISIPRWAAAQIMSRNAPRIREELERNGTGTFLPTFKRRWYVDGKESFRTSVLMPGYIFFVTGGEPIGGIDGVICVVGEVRGEEFYRLSLGCKLGEWNDIAASPIPIKRHSRRRRRPRPGKFIRAKMRAERECA